MKVFRNYWVFIVLISCLLLMSGSSQRGTHPAKRPVLIVGTDYAPPFYSQLPDGTIVGVAVDVFRSAAAELDFDLKFVAVSGSSDEAVRSHRVDLWPLLTITNERSREFHMTEPWLYTTFSLLHLSSAPVPNAASLRLAHWANPVNTQHARRLFPESHLLPLSSRQEVMRSVCFGEADAGLIENRVLDSLLLARPTGCETTNLAREPVPGAAFPMGILSAKSAARQADDLHRQITKMANSGQLGKIFEKWASVTANEAHSIVAMNAARQRTRMAYAAGALIMIAAGFVVVHSRRVRNAYRVAHREVAERKRAQEAHRQADRVRNLVLEGVGAGICGLDAHGKTTFLNSSAAKLLGRESQPLEGIDFHTLVHGPNLDLCTASACQFYSGREPITEIRVDMGTFCRLDGSAFPVEFICSPLCDDETYIGSVISFVDITARRQAELLDRDRNAVLEMLAENRSLEQVFEAIARLVEQQYSGTTCTIDIGPSARVCGSASYRDQSLADGQGSYWSYPILSATNEVLGAIALYGAPPEDSDLSHRVLLQIACRLARLAIEQTRLNQQLHHQAHHDNLTGLPNRLMFEQRLNQALVRSKQNQTVCALFYIDLDRFKQINDTLSHHVGDLYLCQVAVRLQRVLPGSATMARLGGDEFAILVPSIRDSVEAEEIACNLLRAMSQPFSVESFTLFGTASIGISFSTRESTVSELQTCADQAMYRAKSQGRNRFQFYSSDMSRRAIAQLEIEHYIREALESDQFLLHYQPQCRANGDLIGFEALIRLRHPERGLIPPGEFIPVAEDSGLIVRIGSWVLREACRQLASWRDQGRLSLTIAVNVSAAQMSQGDFAREVATVLAEYDVPPAALDIELTESMIMGNFEESLLQMSRLRELGVTLSIDDFGTGYSSLSYLHRLPVQAIKIDQSFVRGMDAEISTRPLVEAIVAAARSLTCNVIAEGVETDAQRRDLARMGCDHMQGYFFSRPLPAAEVLLQFESMALAS